MIRLESSALTERRQAHTVSITPSSRILYQTGLLVPSEHNPL
uniref:Uncharacterized protein n=1 Tax=Anguilla anguilla TaxID=7936 RepID=A0A0E9VX93_ANGAN